MEYRMSIRTVISINKDVIWVNCEYFLYGEESLAHLYKNPLDGICDHFKKS